MRQLHVVRRVIQATLAGALTIARIHTMKEQQL